MNVLYLCNGQKLCGTHFNCYLNGGDCKYTMEERFAKTLEGARYFGVDTSLTTDSTRVVLVERDSQDFLTV